MVIGEARCDAFVSGLLGTQGIAQNQLDCMGYGKAYADPYVIEMAIRDTPLRLSFKFRQSTLSCCINLRPYTTVFGQPGDSSQQASYRNWVAAHYGAQPQNNDHAPYFKPYGRPPTRPNGNTVDTYFDLASTDASGIDLSKPAWVKTCPEFPNMAGTVKLPLTLAEAVQRILLRAPH